MIIVAYQKQEGEKKLGGVKREEDVEPRASDHRKLDLRSR